MRRAAVLSMCVGSMADISAVVHTDFEFGWCSTLNPSSPPPSNPGYWCDAGNRGTTESNCFTQTQNCCYFAANDSDPAYPGMGACVHKDPCPSGQKVCGGKCYDLQTDQGIMTCMRSPGTDIRPNTYVKYSKKACVPNAAATSEDLGHVLDYLCGQTQVNCAEINPGGCCAHKTPGLLPAGSPADEATYSQTAWAMNQYYLLTGADCDFGGKGMLVDFPSAGPTPPTPPSPTPPPPTPTPPPPSPPSPTPKPTPPPSTCSNCTGGACCDPTATPKQMCPGAKACCSCGSKACQC